VDFGGEMQREALQRLTTYAGMVWLVAAIAAGLYAQEIKNRRFWIWLAFSLVSGPIAWYFLLARVSVYIPPERRVNCFKCQRIIRNDARRCPHCREWLVTERPDRAADLGRQAASAIFTARRLLGSAKKAADSAASMRRGKT
jgi:hypothetical protein